MRTRSKMAVGFCRCVLFGRFTPNRSILGRISTIRTSSTAADSTDNQSPSVLLQRAGFGEITKVHTPVHPHVATVLQNSRPKFVRGNWRKAKVSGRRLAELRKMYVGMGYYWPEKPMIDRGLDTTPKGHRYEREKEARLAKIEENMKNMPKIIEEYRKKMKAMRLKRKEEKKEAKERSVEARRLGVHPKDPRGIRAVHGEEKSKKKKFQKKAK